jgi:hypothetical protein
MQDADRAAKPGKRNALFQSKLGQHLAFLIDDRAAK